MLNTLHTAGKLAGNLPGLLLEAERVAHSFMKGVHGRRRVGAGETFWQFRHWAPGDSRRDIDWKQTAKRDDVYIRQHEWEAAQQLWLWRDSSASMGFSSARGLPTKQHMADVLLLALGIVALEGGEQVGLIGSDLAPQAHPSSIRRIAESLPLQSALAETARPVPRRAHAVVFSDFYFDTDRLSAFCGMLSQREVRGLLVQVTDPAEEAFPYQGRMRFRDPENPGDALTIEQVESVQARYHERFHAHRDAVAGIAARNGWKFMNISTEATAETNCARLYETLAAKPKG